MGTDVLNGKTADGVLRKLAVFTLVYNLVRLVMLAAAEQQGVPPDRIRFVEAPPEAPPEAPRKRPRKTPRKTPTSALAPRRGERSRGDGPDCDS